MNAALAFNWGFDYRRPFIFNWLVVFNWLLWFIWFSVIVFLDPNGFGCLYRTNCADQSLINWWHEKGALKNAGTFSTAPPGCPCDEQIADDEWCEAEYIDCQNEHFNIFYHHDIIPNDWRWKFYAFYVANLAAVMLFEGLVVLGPVRKWIRRRREAKGAYVKPILGLPPADEPYSQDEATADPRGSPGLPPLDSQDEAVTDPPPDSQDEAVPPLDSQDEAVTDPPEEQSPPEQQEGSAFHVDESD